MTNVPLSDLLLVVRRSLIVDTYAGHILPDDAVLGRSRGRRSNSLREPITRAPR